jgi:hypothetical protein
MFVLNAFGYQGYHYDPDKISQQIEEYTEKSK